MQDGEDTYHVDYDNTGSLGVTFSDGKAGTEAASTGSKTLSIGRGGRNRRFVDECRMQARQCEEVQCVVVVGYETKQKRTVVR